MSLCHLLYGYVDVFVISHERDAKDKKFDVEVAEMWLFPLYAHANERGKERRTAISKTE